MAASASFQHLAPSRSSFQITGDPAPAVRIRCWRRFAARLPRPPPRRRNALREKASWAPPPLVVRHQVRPPYDGSPEFGSLDSQELESAFLDDEPSSDLDKDLNISGGQGASRSANEASVSKLDDFDVVRDAGEEIKFRETGAGSVFSIYEDHEGNVVQVEVNEDEILNRSSAAEAKQSVKSEFMLSRARAMAIELESSEHVAPNSSSLFQLAVVGRMESPVLYGEVSVARGNGLPSRRVPWSAFAALCSVCLVSVASKLIRSNRKAQLPRKLFCVHRPDMKEDDFGKGYMNVFRNGQEFPVGLLRRPKLDRKELMDNIKRAQESRKWFTLSNPFSHKAVATYDDTNITEIRRNVTEVHAPVEGILEKYSAREKDGIVIPHTIDAIEEEVSASYGSQSDLDDIPDSSESTDISLSNDKIEESVKQPVDLKNGSQITNTSEKDDEENTGEIELPEPTYSNERATATNDRTSVIYTSEKEAQIGSANDCKLGPNTTDFASSEFENNEPFEEICEKNLDRIKGTEPSLPFISEKQMIYPKDNAHQFSVDIVSESSDGFSISSCELINDTPMDGVSDLNGIQGTEAPRTSANVAYTARCEEFSHNMKIVCTEACKTPVMADTMPAISPQRSREEPVDVRRDKLQTMQESETSISSRNSKQLSHNDENEHKERIVHNKTETRMETEHTGILDNASTPSLCALQEETVQHTSAEVSISQKKQGKRTLSNKKPRAHLSKKKGKLQKEVCSDKEAETNQSKQGISGSKAVIDPSNHVEKTKGVPKKRLKKVKNEVPRVPAQDDVQSSSMVDQKKNRQNVKKARRKNLKNAFHSQGAQTREENLETGHIISSPDNAPINNTKPLGLAAVSVETQFSKDAFIEDLHNGFSPSTTRKEELKLNF